MQVEHGGLAEANHLKAGRPAISTVSVSLGAKNHATLSYEGAARTSFVPESASLPPSTAKQITLASETTETPTAGVEKNAERTSEKSAYLAAGRLTRLPLPLVPVDLNDDEIAGMEPAGSIELTILINADGTVADVKTPDYNGSTKVFASIVSERFRNARFSPGEINGRPVKTRLQITVVSENSLSVDSTQFETRPLQSNADLAH